MAAKYTPDHPPYAWMIERAIGSLKEEGGSNPEAISNHICKNFTGLPLAHDRLFPYYLQKNTMSGSIVCSGGRYMMATPANAGRPAMSNSVLHLPSDDPPFLEKEGDNEGGEIPSFFVPPARRRGRPPKGKAALAAATSPPPPTWPKKKRELYLDPSVVPLEPKFPPERRITRQIREKILNQPIAAALPAPQLAQAQPQPDGGPKTRKILAKSTEQEDHQDLEAAVKRDF